MDGTFARDLTISPRVELFFALAAALGWEAGDRRSDTAQRWLDQARRKLDQSFRRRLGDLGQTPQFWIRLAALPLPRAALSPDVDGVIAALATLEPESLGAAPDPEARQLLVLDALRRFDRLAFAAYWRPWREELVADAGRMEALLRAAPAVVEATIFVPSRFAAPGFVAPVAGGGAVLRSFDPDRLTSQSASLAAPRVRAAPAARDPALIFRALGDATRYTIAGLIAREPMTSAELARQLGISKPTMAHHLRALRAAGLVNEETQGTRIVLTLERAVLERLSELAVAQLFGTGTAAPIRRSRRPRASSAPIRRR